MSVYVEPQQWSPALEAKNNIMGYEIIAVTLMKQPQKRGRERKKKEEEVKEEENYLRKILNNNFNVKIVRSQGNLRRCIVFGRIK